MTNPPAHAPSRRAGHGAASPLQALRGQALAPSSDTIPRAGEPGMHRQGLTRDASQMPVRGEAGPEATL